MERTYIYNTHFNSEHKIYPPKEVENTYKFTATFSFKNITILDLNSYSLFTLQATKEKTASVAIRHDS